MPGVPELGLGLRGGAGGTAGRRRWQRQQRLSRRRAAVGGSLAARADKADATKRGPERGAALRHPGAPGALGACVPPGPRRSTCFQPGWRLGGAAGVRGTGESRALLQRCAPPPRAQWKRPESRCPGQRLPGHVCAVCGNLEGVRARTLHPCAWGLTDAGRERGAQRERKLSVQREMPGGGQLHLPFISTGYLPPVPRLHPAWGCWQQRLCHGGDSSPRPHGVGGEAGRNVGQEPGASRGAGYEIDYEVGPGLGFPLWGGVGVPALRALAKWHERSQLRPKAISGAHPARARRTVHWRRHP